MIFFAKRTNRSFDQPMKKRNLALTMVAIEIQKKIFTSKWKWFNDVEDRVMNKIFKTIVKYTIHHA